MHNVTYKNVHNRFKLNGIHLDRRALCLVGYNYIKEGDAAEIAVGDFILDWFDSKSYIELSTSGTTGVPKKIRIEKQAMVHSALATGNYFDLQPGDKALHCLPTKFIAGKMMFVRSFILGLDLDYVAPSSHPMENNTTKYDFVAMVPLQVENSLKALDNVKKMIVGGAKMSAALEKSLFKLKTEIYETYGMTETITHIAAKKLGEKAFTILPNVKIQQDDRKCLVIDAPKIASQTIVTNDIVDLVNEKQFIFLGRIDNVINSGGVKLIPEQIEAKLAGRIQSRFFVAGVPDSVLGEKLVLIIEGAEQSLDEAVFDGLDKFEKPKAVFYVPLFLETLNGKIKRKEITASLK
jgi:O-succinylbenzoic acid--CoA ligase